MKKISLSIIIFLIVIFMGSIVEAESANLSFYVSSGSCYTGDSITVTVSFRELSAYSLRINYDNNLVEYINEVRPSGEYANDAGGSLTILNYGEQGKKTSTSVRFRAKSVGSASFSLTANGLSVETASTVVSYDAASGSASVNITVPPPPPPPPDPVYVTGISFDVTNRTLNKGENFIIYETITPDNADNKSVTWTSSNSSVASVDSTRKSYSTKRGRNYYYRNNS